MKYNKTAISPEIKTHTDMKIDMDNAPCIFRLEKYVSVYKQNPDTRVSKEVAKEKLIDEIINYILSNLKIKYNYDLYSNIYVWRGELLCYLYDDEKEKELTDKIIKLEHELENKKREIIKLKNDLKELNKPWWRRLFS